MANSNAPWGLLAEFDSAYGVYHAAEKVRDAGFQKWDTHTPFCVHGMDDAMGLGPSKLPWISLVMGLTGLAAAVALQTWVSTTEYPMVISGKPLNSLPAFVPLMFEITVLFAAIGTVFGMFFLNGLPMLHHPLFSSERFERVTDDKFFISIESTDSKFDSAKTADFLREIGAKHVEVIEG